MKLSNCRSCTVYEDKGNITYVFREYDPQGGFLPKKDSNLLL